MCHKSWGVKEAGRFDYILAGEYEAQVEQNNNSALHKTAD